MSKMDIARLAAQLARTTAARAMTVDEIAADAVRIYEDSALARRAAEAGRTIAPHVAKIAPRLDAYGAAIVGNGDALGLVIGLKFDDGSYRNGARNIFHVV